MNARIAHLRHQIPLTPATALRTAALAVVVCVVALAITLPPLPLAGILVAGSIIFVLTLIRPEVGLYGLVLAVPFGSVRELSVGGFTVDASEALLALVVAAWLAQMIIAGEIRTIHPPLLLPLLVFIGAGLLSWTAALSIKYSLKETLKWVEVLAVYLFVANRIEHRPARVLLAVILLAGLGEALLGIYQFFFQIGPEGFIWLKRFMRAYGTFRQPNPYGGYLGLVLPLAYGIAVSVPSPWRRLRTTLTGRRFPTSEDTSGPKAAANPSPGSPAQERWRLVVWLLAVAGCGLMALAMVMSGSRGAMLSFAVAFVAMNVVRSRRAAVLFGLAAVLAASGLLLSSLHILPASITQRFLDVVPLLSITDVRGVEVTPANFALIERLAHWQAAWGMFSDHPWLGVGLGNYAAVYPAYALPRWSDPLGHAHNYYLNISAEAGLVGLSAYLLLIAAILWQAWRAVRRTSGFWQGVAVGILGVLVHLTTHNFFDNLYVHGMYIHIAILLGLLYVISQVETSEVF